MKTASTTATTPTTSVSSLWGRRMRYNNNSNDDVDTDERKDTCAVDEDDDGGDVVSEGSDDHNDNDDDIEHESPSSNKNIHHHRHGGPDDIDRNGTVQQQSLAHSSSLHHQEEYNTMISLTMELVQTLVAIRPGDLVMTPYGTGRLEEKKNRNGSMVIDIGFGKLYFKQPEMIHKVISSNEYQQAIDHLEVIRKLQLAGQCEQWNVPFVDGVCVACLFDKPEVKRYEDNTNRRKSGRWRINRSSSLNSTNRLKKKKKAPQVCDVCNNPVCANHKIAMAGTTSETEHFCMCVDCSFDLTQIKVQLDPNHPQLKQNLDRLLQYYTRMVLQLCFVIPTLRDVAANLTTKERRNSHIALGTGGLSFVGAALGVAGAAALLTPVGHVILLAAAATSASSAAIQGTHAGYNMMLSSREANLVADRALGWHGLCLGILDSLEQLRKDLLAEHIKSGYDDADLLDHLSNGGRNNTTSKKSQALEVWNTLAVGGFHTTRHGLTGVGLTAQLGASYSQAISASIQTVPVVGAAFSVGCMAMDASNISSTLQKLQKPLAKALALQEIEVSFSTHIPATIQYEVEALMRAIVDLRERHEEVQRNQENDLIEQELEELNFT